MTSAGGVAARRAIARWAWRLFRREWRQQVLVLTLLTVAVAAATFIGALAYNVTTGPEGRFGRADHRIQLANSDSASTEADLTSAREHFGTIEVIGSRFARVPGSVESVELRAQDPEGAYSGPMLTLLEGRFPTAENEVAVTDSVAGLFDVGVGDSFDLEGNNLRVVGLVENQNDLADEFAIVSPAHAETPQEVTVLVTGSGDRLDDFSHQMTTEGGITIESARNEKAMAVMITYIFVTVGMLLVALIAAAGFVVLAQRRMRQLGMLAAIGATERQVRFVSLANGLVVGAVAAVVGTSFGVVAWMLASERVEESTGHRIEGLSLPLWVIGMTMLLAVVTASASAWWPGRAVARIPIILALSSRPPRPKAVHRSTVLAALLIIVGLVAFEMSNQTNVLLAIAGTVAIPLGILLISPLTIRALAAIAPRLPIAGRLALRDLVRHQARSGAALAAITLALGIAVTVVASANAAQHSAGEGNLSDRQLIIRVGNPPEPSVVPQRTRAELAAMDAEVDRFVDELDGATVSDLDMVVNPASPTGPGVSDPTDYQAAHLVKQRTETNYAGFPLYVATPQLLAHLGTDQTSIDSYDVLTVLRGEVLLPDDNKFEPVTSVGRIEDSDYSSVPDSFITPPAVDRLGWERIRAGWFIETEGPLTDEQIAAAREMAAAAGMTIEPREDQSQLATMRLGATAAGAVLALGILAMTVGLIRGEAAADLRTLSATGATSRIRRALTASTAGALAFAGAALGIVGAYVTLIAGDVAGLTNVPVLHLIVIVAGIPLVSTGCGWLLAGREPAAVARRILE